MIVVVCGSRFNDATIELQLRVSLIVCAILDRLPDGTLVITGGAGGVDTWADTQARERPRLAEPKVMLAEWEIYGKRAGAIRNRAMLDERPNMVYAVWDGRSPGTRDMITETRRRGIPLELIEA